MWSFISTPTFVNDFCEFTLRIIVELKEIWKSSGEIWFTLKKSSVSQGYPTNMNFFVLFCFPIYIHIHFHSSLPRFLVCHNPSLTSMVKYRFHWQILALALVLSVIFFGLCIGSTNFLRSLVGLPNLDTMLSPTIIISLKILGNKQNNYPWTSGVWL